MYFISTLLESRQKYIEENSPEVGSLLLSYRSAINQIRKRR